MSVKIAVALFVRDEASDIATWLAWYFTIGVNTVFVYDDHSVDGTWDILQVATKQFDVRAFRTDLSTDHYYNRQRDAYRDAIERAHGEFAWLGFFDSDEYLFVGSDRSVSDFLTKYDAAKAVAISWAIYGSAGHVTKPATPIIEAFTRHSDISFGHNGSIKSFIRPEAVGPLYINPHRFDIEPSAYFNAAGEVAHWTHAGGFAPDWREAKVMHFICRSMQHFTERLQRRFDLRDTGHLYWTTFDTNDHEDLEPLKLLPQLYGNIHLIDRGCLSRAAEVIAASAQTEVPASEIPNARQLAAFRVKTAEGKFLYLESGSGQVRLVEEPEAANEELSPLFAATNSTLGEGGYMFVLSGRQHQGPILLGGESRISAVQAYVLFPISGHLIGIQHPLTTLFLTASIEGVAFSQSGISRLEQFELVPEADTSSIEADLENIKDGLRQGLTCDGLNRWVKASSGAAKPGVFGALVSLLNEREKLRFSACAPAGLTPGWATALGRTPG